MALSLLVVLLPLLFFTRLFFFARVSMTPLVSFLLSDPLFCGLLDFLVVLWVLLYLKNDLRLSPLLDQPLHALQAGLQLVDALLHV